MIIKIQYILLLGVTLFFAACSQTTAKFLVQGTKQVAPARVSFENKSVKAERFEWDFGDGKNLRIRLRYMITSVREIIK